MEMSRCDIKICIDSVSINVEDESNNIRPEFRESKSVEITEAKNRIIQIISKISHRKRPTTKISYDKVQQRYLANI